MRALARKCFQWRFAVLGGWIAALVALVMLVIGFGAAFTDAAEMPDSESATAYRLLAESGAGDAGTEQGTIAWHTDGVAVGDATVRRQVTAMLGRVAAMPGVRAVVSPYEPAGARQLNAAADTAYATVVVAEDADVTPITGAATSLRSGTLDVEVGGTAFSEQPGASHGTEIVGILAALAILLLVFRSLWAAVLPIVTGVVGVGASLLVVMLASHAVDLAATSLTMGALIGLGVGIDYALFIVNRYRKALLGGSPVPEAIAQALDTSGRAVVFAGVTVMIALLGMFVVDLGILTGMAQAAAVTVLFTVAAAVTLLPALLGILGDRVLSRRQRATRTDTTPIGATPIGATPIGATPIGATWTGAAGSSANPHGVAPADAPRAHAARTHVARTGAAGPGAVGSGSVPGVPQHRAGLAARWAALVQRAPRRMGLLALLVIVTLAAPVAGMRVGDADASSDPAGSAARDYYELMAAGFGPGFDASLLLVARTPDPASARAFSTLVGRLRAVDGVAAVAAAPVAAGQRVAVATVVPATSAQTEETTDLVGTLRDDVIPAAESGTGLRVYVGGTTATSIDISAALIDKLPLYLGLIAALGFLLLAVAFRSVLVPLVGALTNVATIFVGLGAVTAIFQLGWGAELLGVGSGAPVMYLVPVIIVGVMFGLSMDYQVFLVSRMHEEWAHTRDNRRAVRSGVAETGQVIAAAALIMLCVFASFGFSGERIVSAIGIGLGVAALVDAFVVRLTLVPALMRLLGRANWWYPRWAERITPRLSVEGAVPPPAPAPVAPGGREPVGAGTGPATMTRE